MADILQCHLWFNHEMTTTKIRLLRFWLVKSNFQPFRNTTQICVVLQEYRARVSLISQTSFDR